MAFGSMASAGWSRCVCGFVVDRVAPLLLNLFPIVFAVACCVTARQNEAVPLSHPDDATQSTRSYYANAHPYLNEPIEQLMKRIPELEGLKPAADQHALATILQRTGERVDESYRTIVDLSSQETITLEKFDGQGRLLGQETFRASYLILRRGAPTLGWVEEYRTNANGESIVAPGLRNGYFVTSNFALMPAYLSTSQQPETRFRYLGEQSVAERTTYVVAFAQKPEEASVPLRLEGDGGPNGHYRVDLLVQGVVWIDEETAQILRMKTDLLAPRPEIGLDWLTTTVKTSEFRVTDVTNPFWLPSEVGVSAHFRNNTFRNEHHYSDYQQYRVSARMVPETAPLSLADRGRPGNDLAITPENADLTYYANAHPYLADPPKQLVERIPELGRMKPATNEQALGGILQKAGANVDAFFVNVVDVIAQEKITMQRGTPRGYSAPAHVEDSYLILRKPVGNRREVVEYRMDAAGQPLDNVGLRQGFVTTRGFALVCNYFATGWQHESMFRYLGDEKIGARDAYVVGFAQTPGRATMLVTMRAANGGQYPILIQGVAWIDKVSFQILRMRTDLLAPHPELALEQQTTDVTFGEVRLVDVATPLWLPKDVKVYVKFKEHGSGDDWMPKLSYRNEHHYSNYRHYGVSVKMVGPG